MSVKQYSNADFDLEKRIKIKCTEIRTLNELLNKKKSELKELQGCENYGILRRKEVIPIDEVENAMKDKLFEPNKVASMIEVRGDLIKSNSHRYQTFFTNGTKCTCCGIEGKYFAKEKHLGDGHFHLNLYGIDENGEEVMMRSHHIKDKRTKSKIYYPICSRCKEKMGHTKES